MNSKYVSEADSGRQPCVVFESINALMVTRESLRYVDDEADQFYVRKWQIMSLNTMTLEKECEYCIHFETIISVIEKDDLEHCDALAIKVDENCVDWGGIADLASNEYHFNADTAECDLKFNAIIAIMRRAVEIDIDFAIDMHNDNDSETCTYH